jgi:energy-coupling factor transporter ATP-binding protein EcfA2
VQLDVRNFQSLEDISLEVRGLTVIVGPTNSGKSALVRALSSALFNRSGSHFLRKGEKETTVEVQGLPTTGEPVDVTWVKGKKPTVFTVNGDEFRKVGKGTPEPLTSGGYRDVELRDATLRPQVSGQHDGLFLGHATGSTLVDALAAASRLDIYSRAIELCTEDLRKAALDAKGTAVRAVEAESLLAGLQPRAEAWLQAARELQAQAEALQTRRASLAVAASVAARHTVARRIAKPVVLSAPPLTALPKLISAFRQWHTARTISWLPGLPALPSTAVGEAAKVWSQLQAARGVAAPTELTKLPTTRARELVGVARTFVLARRVSPPARLPAMVESSGLDTTLARLEEWRRAAVSVKAIRSLHVGTQAALGQVTQEFEELRALSPGCPVCGSPSWNPAG